MTGKFQRFARDIVGVLALTSSVITLLALLFPGLTQGILLLLWIKFLHVWLGWGSLWIVLLLAYIGLLFLRRPFSAERSSHPVNWGRIFAIEAAAFSSLTLLAALGNTSLQRADAGLDGGRIGWGLSYLMGVLLEPIGFNTRFWLVFFSISALGLFTFLGTGLVVPFINWIQRQTLESDLKKSGDGGTAEAVSIAPIVGSDQVLNADSQRKKRSMLPAEFRKKFKIQDEPDKVDSNASLVRDDRLPGLDLLVNEQNVRPDERNINLTAGLIEKTLSEFGIPARVVGFRVGPTVTQFAVEPGFVEKTAQGVEGDPNRQKISRFANFCPQP